MVLEGQNFGSLMKMFQNVGSIASKLVKMLVFWFYRVQIGQNVEILVLKKKNCDILVREGQHFGF